MSDRNIMAKTIQIAFVIGVLKERERNEGEKKETNDAISPNVNFSSTRKRKSIKILWALYDIIIKYGTIRIY